MFWGGCVESRLYTMHVFSTASELRPCHPQSSLAQNGMFGSFHPPQKITQWLITRNHITRGAFESPFCSSGLVPRQRVGLLPRRRDRTRHGTGRCVEAKIGKRRGAPQDPQIRPKTDQAHAVRMLSAEKSPHHPGMGFSEKILIQSLLHRHTPVENPRPKNMPKRNMGDA